MPALLLVAAFLLGSIPVGYILPKLIRGIDVRTTGSGNTGFTNVYRAAGVVLGTIVLVVDMGKGALAVYLARAGGGGEGLAVLAGFAAIAGNVWSPFLRFRGGKGAATAGGVFFTLIPIETAISLLLFIAVVGATRFVSLGSITAVAALPASLIVIARLRHTPVSIPALGLTLLVTVLIVLRHRSNIRRLLDGTESRFLFRRRESGNPKNGESEVSEA